MVEEFSDTALLVPPGRLGRLLREQRTELGRSIGELSESSQLSEALLEDAEKGYARLDDSTLVAIAGAYEIDTQRLSPQRAELVIDLDEGWIAASEHQVAINPSDVLSRYLALVYTLRELPSGTKVPLRDLDIGVLAHALETDRDGIEHELNGLMTRDSRKVEKTSSTLRSRLVVPLAGILVGVTAVGGLVLVRAEPPVVVGDDVPVDIGDAIMIASPDSEQTER